MPAKATTIDDWLSRVSADKRSALEKLRRDILAAAPGAEEAISYGIPAFKLDGRLLVWMGAGANHCSFYPGALPIARHAAELAGYETSKGTIRFAPDRPLPAALVATLVRVRVKENAARTAATTKRERAASAAAARKGKGTSKRPGAKRASAKRATPERASAKPTRAKPASAKPASAKGASAKGASAKRATSKRASAKRAAAKRRTATNRRSG